MKHALVVLLMLFVAGAVYAEAPYYKGNSWDLIHEVWQPEIVDWNVLDDGYMLIVYHATKYGDPMLGEAQGVAKINHLGYVIWNWMYQQPSQYDLETAVELSNGGVVVFARHNTLTGFHAGYISPNGQLNGMHTFPAAALVTEMKGYPIALSEGGGVFLAYKQTGLDTWYFTKINSQGIIEWDLPTQFVQYELTKVSDDRVVILGKNIDGYGEFHHMTVDGGELLSQEFPQQVNDLRDVWYDQVNQQFSMLYYDTGNTYHVLNVDMSATTSSVTIQNDTDLNLVWETVEDGYGVIGQSDLEPLFYDVPVMHEYNEFGELLWTKIIDADYGGVVLDGGRSYFVEALDVWGNSGNIRVFAYKALLAPDPLVTPRDPGFWQGRYYSTSPQGPPQLDVVPLINNTVTEGDQLPLDFNVWSPIDSDEIDVWYNYYWWQGFWEPYGMPYVEEGFILGDQIELYGGFPDLITGNIFPVPELPAFVTDRRVLVQVNIGAYPSYAIASDYISLYVEESPNFMGEDGIVVPADGLPSNYSIGHAAPNPFNPSTKISVQLPETNDLTVMAYDVQGRKVAELAKGSYGSGTHHFTFDGRELASGVYFIRVSVPGHMNEVQKVVLAK